MNEVTYIKLLKGAYESREKIHPRDSKQNVVRDALLAKLGPDRDREIREDVFITRVVGANKGFTKNAVRNSLSNLASVEEAYKNHRIIERTTYNRSLKQKLGVRKATVVKSRLKRKKVL